MTTATRQRSRRILSPDGVRRLVDDWAIKPGDKWPNDDKYRWLTAELTIPESINNRPVAEQPVGLAIMAKAPRAGAVKTRLCPPLRPPEAAELARCFLLDAVDRVAAVAGVRPVLAYAPVEARGEFESIAPGFALLAQQGEDLGARMSWKKARTVSASSFEPAISASRTLRPSAPTPQAASTASRRWPGRSRSAMPSTNR